MRILSVLLLAATLNACSSESFTEDATAAEQGVSNEVNTPLDCDGLRFDGYYMEQRGSLLYFIRFFPDGKAVLVNGTDDLREELPTLLVANAKGDPTMGYYNVPVELRNDSMFFTTTPEKGTIDYLGAVVDDTRVRFLRKSNINGSEQLKEYLFVPDPLKQ